MKNLNSFNKIKQKIGILLFNKRKALKYIFFDKIYSAFILNKKNLPKFLDDYNTDGFVKIFPNFKEKLNELINSLIIEDNQKTEPPYYFKINDEIKNKLNDILDIINKEYLISFKKYFNSDILPAYVCLRRNTKYKKTDLKNELFNDNFHNDAYLFTHFKVFINLSNISDQEGPMKIVSKKKAKDFLKHINYEDRQNYNEENENFSYSNKGKIGDCLFFDPTNCFHKAGMPEENCKRDYLIITYVCIPRKTSLINELIKTDIFKYENNKILSLAKPTHLLQTLKLLFNYYKTKLS